MNSHGTGKHDQSVVLLAVNRSHCKEDKTCWKIPGVFWGLHNLFSTRETMSNSSQHASELNNLTLVLLEALFYWLLHSLLTTIA